MPLEKWWQSSQGSRRHGSVLVRSACAGPDIEKIGFGVCSMPPQPVVVKRVTSETWASEQNVQVGDVLLEVGARLVAEMSSDEFMEAMRARPLHLAFAISPLRARAGRHGAGPIPEESEPESGSGSSSGSEDQAEGGCSVEEQVGGGAAARQSLSDWYADPSGDGGEAAPRQSLSGWYLDGGEEPDSSSKLTVFRRLSESAEASGQDGSAPNMGEVLEAAAVAGDIVELMDVLARAETEGIMSDIVDSARERLKQLQGQVLSRATVARF